MAARGKNTHFRWAEIRTRHWIETAKKSKISKNIARQVIGELLEKTPEVVEKISANLPTEMLTKTSEQILKGLSKRALTALAETDW